MDSATLKTRVKAHWEDETCGVRYATATDRATYFDEVTEARYRLEPYIASFARFPEAAGKTVLEIGVGAGTDFSQWCRHAVHATGIDLTESAIALTRERLALANVPLDRYSLQVADAEQLPFADDAFDIVYSWGVLHHTPDTEATFREARRVLRPGGTLRAMVYHVPSWVGLMFVLKSLVLERKLRSAKQALYDDLESPGTQAYNVPEARALLEGAGFSEIRASARLSFGDLFEFQLSARRKSRLFPIAQRLYPRPLVRALGDRFGLNLLIEARKPG